MESMRSALIGEVNALMAAGRHDEAEAALQQDLAERPDDPATLDALGVCLYFQNRIEDSIEAFRRAVALDGNRPTTWYNLGTSLSDAGLPEDAVWAYRQCLARDPANESAKYNLSRSLLLLGQWQEGWPLYEARGRKKNPLYTALNYDRWVGEPPGPFALVLTTEQGIGDAIQFARFAGYLKRTGYEVLVWTAPLLAPLLKGCTDIGHVYSGSGLRVEGAPVKWSPLMSVPAAINLTPEILPSAPYVGVDPTRVAHWRQRIGTNGYKIGILWQGNIDHANDARRSMQLADLEPITQIPGVRLFSLQKQPGSTQLAESGIGQRIEILTDDADVSAEALLDTAAIITNLNMVISVDSMVAHLAGALGRSVWLALDDRPDWRWLLDRTNSPWYPTMRLFRQQKRGDWNQVVAAMASALQKARLA
jgi:tetratricopeptide (TPR) repeat protein